MDFKKLIGITIEDIILEESSIHDDDPSVIIHADNGARFRIEGGYGAYTGESQDEYPTKLWLTAIDSNTNKGSLVKKKRGVRVISSNNSKKEYDTKMSMVLEEFKRLDYDERLLLIDKMKLEV